MLDIDEVLEAAQQDSGIGFCLDCGEEAHCIEPDASGYKCEHCGAFRVMGAEQILIEEVFS